MTVTVVPSQQILNPQLEIAGNRRLAGELRVSGAKNSALVLMAASLLTEDQLRLRNVPPLTDIQGMGEILASLGVTVRRGNDSLEMNGSGLNQSAPPYELVNSLRASGPGVNSHRVGVSRRVPLVLDRIDRGTSTSCCRHLPTAAAASSLRSPAPSC